MKNSMIVSLYHKADFIRKLLIIFIFYPLNIVLCSIFYMISYQLIDLRLFSTAFQLRLDYVTKGGSHIVAKFVLFSSEGFQFTNVCIRFGGCLRPCGTL